MRTVPWPTRLCLAGLALLVLAPGASAQQRPYIGFVYPAGGQQGTTVQVHLGGQGVDDVTDAIVTGPGVTARLVECRRRFGNQEMQLLNDQLRELKRAKPATAAPMTPMTSGTTTGKTVGVLGMDQATTNLIVAIENRTRDIVPNPACTAIAALVIVEVTLAPDAPPGERELRLVTQRGVSNPLVFHVGQVPESSRKPMLSATIQVLGKEASALRKRPPDEAEDRITVPCTVNGQIASGEVNRYRFAARQGQRLVITTLGRQLIPYIADAVPGWFQPVLVLSDAKGNEVAYDDDYRFKPDPVILYEVPRDGDYVVAIRDALYRGREDFVYRITIGELPFVTSIFPSGGRVGEPVTIKMKGWNLEGAELERIPWLLATWDHQHNKPPHRGPQTTAGPASPPNDGGEAIPSPASSAGEGQGEGPGRSHQQSRDALATNGRPGVYQLAANRKGFVSNRVPFALDTLPECFEKEPNNDLAHAQKVTLPVMINGRIDRPDDWDLFQFAGRSNDTIVAEVYARRLDSPLDSVLKLTDAKGTLLAFNDDREDPGSGLNTHHADSYFMAKLPADGAYFIQIGDTARNGGEEYVYRLRLSAPQPDFALRVVPSSASLRSKDSTAVSVYAIRKDGFTAPIKLGLKDPPSGFSSGSVTLTGTQAMARLSFKTDLVATKAPIRLTIEGRTKIGPNEIAHEAVPAEDRMQAFLWRHLVPAQELPVLVFDPAYQPPTKHSLPFGPPPLIEAKPTAGTNTTVAAAAAAAAKPKFTKQQVAGRLRELKRLSEEGLLTDRFYWERVAECEAAQ